MTRIALFAPVVVWLASGSAGYAAPASVQSAAPAEPLPLSAPLTSDEAARISLMRNPGLIAARAAVEAARGRVEQARSDLYPSLTASSGYTRVQSLTGSGGTGTSGSGGQGTGWQATVSLRQLAFDFSRTRALARQAAALEQATSAELTRAESDLVMQVTQAFYGLVQNTRLTAVDEANLASSQDHLALARAREQQGVGLPVDVSRAEADVAAATLQLTITRNNAAQSHVALAELMGVDPRTPFATAEAGETVLTSESSDALVSIALKRRAEVHTAEALVAAGTHAEEAARMTSAPGFFVSASVASRGNSVPPPSGTATFGVSLQWTPFDSGFTAGRVRETRANTAAARARLRSAQQAVVADVTQALLNLQAARQRVTAATAGVTAAEDSLRLAEGRYRAGVGTFVEVTDAQAAVANARAGSINAQTAVDQALAALRRATGEPVR